MYLEDPLSKGEVIDCIYNKVEELGFNIEKEQVVSFLDNFIRKYNRLPKESEIKPIVLSYMKIYQEEESPSLPPLRPNAGASGPRCGSTRRVDPA